MQDIENLIRAALALPRDAVCFNLSKALAEATPNQHLLETDGQWAISRGILNWFHVIYRWIVGLG